MRAGKLLSVLCICLLGLEFPLSAHAGFLHSSDQFVAVDLGRVKAIRFDSYQAGEFLFRKFHNEDLGIVAGARWANGFGAQLSWQKLVEIDVASALISPFEAQTFVSTTQARSLALAASYTHELTEKLSLTGQAGVHHWELNGYPSGYDPTWGATVDFRISERWSAGIGWRRFEVNDDHANRSSLQLAFHF